MANSGVQWFSRSYYVSRFLPVCLVGALTLFLLCGGAKGQSAERGGKERSKDERGKGEKGKEQQGKEEPRTDELRKLKPSAGGLGQKVSPNLGEIFGKGY